MAQVREIRAAETMLETLLAEHAKAAAAPARRAPRPALQARLAKLGALGRAEQAVTPFDRMQHCRDSLAYLDTCGWKRSYHQRLFHEDFLVCSLTDPVSWHYCIHIITCWRLPICDLKIIRINRCKYCVFYC